MLQLLILFQLLVLLLIFIVITIIIAIVLIIIVIVITIVILLPRSLAMVRATAPNVEVISNNTWAGGMRGSLSLIMNSLEMPAAARALNSRSAL